MKQTLNFLLISCFGLLMACQPETATLAVETKANQDSIPNKTALNESKVAASPKEAFEIVPEGVYHSLNAKLAASSKKMSPKEVAKMYYPAQISNQTSFEKIEVQTEKKGTQTIVTLTHDNQSEHIRIQGHRIVITLEEKEAQWQIILIQQQFKCWLRKDGVLWSNDKCS
jgi:hypothetical protein